MVTRFLLMVLLASVVFAQCTWECDDWSECSTIGYNTRTCMSQDCTENKPIEIKRCDDADLYEVNNTQESFEAASKDLKLPTSNPPDIFVGLGIVLGFIVLGALIGRKINQY